MWSLHTSIINQSEVWLVARYVSCNSEFQLRFNFVSQNNLFTGKDESNEFDVDLKDHRNTPVNLPLASSTSTYSEDIKKLCMWVCLPCIFPVSHHSTKLGFFYFAHTAMMFPSAEDFPIERMKCFTLAKVNLFIKLYLISVLLFINNNQLMHSFFDMRLNFSR